MKEIIFAFVFTLFAMPALATPAAKNSDLKVDLRPALTDDAVQQWQSFWKTGLIDPANHVVWKLYVFRAIPKRDDPKGNMEYIIAGLTPYPKSSYYVSLRIDILYNYLKTIPKRGDVLVVSGQVLSRRDYLLDLGNKEVSIKMLTMQLDGAANRKEQFDPAATPTGSTTVVVPFTPTPNP